ncbi:glutathione S-transferase family protein [Rhodobacteraceae bacterium M382]|nr:glutathione S-transferase family protein [Rhodobacteraceae bacterium M382]
MTKFKIVGYDYCPFIQPSIIALMEKKADFSVTYIEPGNKPGWVNEVSPQGATPFLLIDGKALFESAAMIEFVNDTTGGDLYPDDAFLKAQNRMWIARSYALLDNLYALKTTDDPCVFKAEKAALRARLGDIEDLIGENPFFNGNDFGLVDGVFAPVLRTIAMLDERFNLNLFDVLPNVRRWSKNVLSRPSVKSSVVENFDERSADKIAQSNALVCRQHAQPAT